MNMPGLLKRRACSRFKNIFTQVLLSLGAAAWLPAAAGAAPIDPALFYQSPLAEQWSAMAHVDVEGWTPYLQVGGCPYLYLELQRTLGSLNPAAKLPDATLFVEEPTTLGSYQSLASASGPNITQSCSATTSRTCWGATNIRITQIAHYMDTLYIQFENPQNVAGLAPASSENPGEIKFRFDYSGSNSYINKFPIQGSGQTAAFFVYSQASIAPGFEVENANIYEVFYVGFDANATPSFDPEPTVTLQSEHALLQVRNSTSLSSWVHDYHPDVDFHPDNPNVRPAHQHQNSQSSVYLRSLPPGYVCYSASRNFPGCDGKPEPPEALIVLTHGWQPGKDISSLQSPQLLAVREALEERLIKENIRHKTRILEFNWPEAFTAGIFSYESLFQGTPLQSPYTTAAELLLTGAVPVLFDVYATLGDYNFSYERTFDAGNRLALEILSFVREQRELSGNSSYDPQIHLIGHSLGTMVNARAVERIYQEGLRDPSSAVSAEQVTILDDPLHVDAAFFYDVMHYGSVDFVENFYASEFAPEAPRFGGPILGTFPCSPTCTGAQALGYNHNDIHATFYAQRILSPAWESPALSHWNPPIRWNPNAARSATGHKIIWNDGGSAFQPAPLEGSVIEVSPGRFQLRAGSVPEEVSTPPSVSASIGLVRNIPQRMRYVRFRLDMAPHGSPVVELSFDGKIIWSTRSHDWAGSGALVTVPLPFSTESARQLKWELRSLTSTEAEVIVDDIEYGTLEEIGTSQAGFHTVPPCRLVDTRAEAGPLGGPALQPQTQRSFVVTDACGVPSTAKAVAINITVVQPAASGHLTFFPDGQPAPLASTINFTAGRTRANNAVLGLGPNGALRAWAVSAGSVPLILDVTGYFE